MSSHADSLRAIGFEKYPPSGELRPFIECFWFIKTENPLSKPLINKVITDGGTGITFNYGSPYRLMEGEKKCLIKDKLVFTGVTDKTFYLALKGNVEAAGIRFRPGTHTLIFKNCKEIILPLNDSILAGISGVYSDMRLLPNSVRVSRLDDFMKGILSGHIGTGCWTSAAAEEIRKQKGSARIDELAALFRMSRRQFDRKFKDGSGMTPKQYSKIVRIENARSMMRDKEPDSLTLVGYECDYYDQAHFIREFKEVVQQTPKEYVHSKKMSRLYNSE